MPIQLKVPQIIIYVSLILRERHEFVMRVLVVNETFNLGGAETMALELANALSAIPGNQVVFASADGILLNRLERGIRYFPITHYKHLNIFRLYFEFKRIVQELKPDVIHPQGATIGIIAGIVARICSPRTKVVITHHSSGFTRVPVGLANFLFKSFADACIAISKAKYDSFIQNGFRKEKIFLIPNFINQAYLLSQATDKNVSALKDSIGVLPGERIVVGAGRLIAGKRFDIFIRTLAECVQQDSKIKILGIILGDGPERKYLQEMIDQMNFPNLRVKLLGFQSNVAVYFRMADVFLFPSEHPEVLPMCLIEATALGVPVVCSNIPGNNDIIENAFNGFLVDIKKKDYSTFILHLLQDEAIRKRFAVNGVAKAEKFYDKDKVVADISAVYKSLGSV